jgi:hypothetical protein
MASQWQRLFQNLGEWQGSFTRFSPQGEQLEAIPSVVSFEGLNDNATMRQVVKLSPPDTSPQEKVYEYSSLSKGILFFENGSFSLGSLQWSPFSEFGAELGLKYEDRRLRLVQLFNRESQLQQVTLIREQLAESDTPQRPPLTVKQLLGEWRGEAVTLYPDLQPATTMQTHLEIRREGNQLSQSLKFGTKTITSTAEITDSKLLFQQGVTTVQILLLPDGASCNCPTEIKPGHPFVLEVGWLIKPTLRQRLVRRYNEKGEWMSLTLVNEEREG